jgi:hypothetical protein
VLPDRFGNAQDMPKICRAILIGWRSDRDKDDLGSSDGFPDVGRKQESTLRLISFDEIFESWLVDWNAIFEQCANLSRIDVRTNDVIARFGQTSTYDETDVTRSDDRYPH